MSDDRSSNADGQTTMLPGITGVSLSYLPGDIVDSDYQLTKLLGRGGMGAVFACKHLVLDKVYAIKLLAGDSLNSDAWTRFQSEAKSLARLNHPHIVGIHNMGIDKGQCPYYVMDLLAGESLDFLLKRCGHLSVDQALDIFIQVADGLSSAHMQGIIHRDIKPSNMMLLQDEKSHRTSIKIVDFGIARLPKHGAEAQSQTATGLIFGTPFYMSPEQCQGAKVDQRSDIYSFGCALFEALTGRPPFVGDNAFHTFLLHQTEEPPDLASSAPKQNFPQSLASALKKMLSKIPNDRYQTMSQVKHDLERIKSGKPILAQGMQNTIPTSITATEKALSPLAVTKRDQRFNKSAQPIEAEIEKANIKPSRSLTPLMIVVISTFFLAGAVGAIFLVRYLYYPQKSAQSPSKPAEIKPPVVPLDAQKPGRETADPPIDATPTDMPFSSPFYPWKELQQLGASDEEVHSLRIEDITPVDGWRRDGEKRLIELQKDRRWSSTTFMGRGVFHFPQDIIIGVISIGDTPPIQAKGDISAPPDKSAFLYLTSFTRKTPELLDKFGPTDLTGIAMVFSSRMEVNKAIDKISSWRRLKDLWFFNPLIKTITTNTEDWAESKITDQDLPRLDKLHGLRSLGLCYPASGPAILERPFLRKISALKLSRIEDFDPLLKALPNFDNLNEIFLQNLETTNEQLKILGQMKNLKKLTVLRGHLTFDSLHILKNMKTLRELHLDRNDWTAKQRIYFRKNLPHCTVFFEKVIDTKYWPVFRKGLAR